MQAKMEKMREDAELQDIYNWQLGDYIRKAIRNVFIKGEAYPDKPTFSGKLHEASSGEPLSERQEEIETRKFQDFFTNLGSYVKIKNKGGRNEQ